MRVTHPLINVHPVAGKSDSARIERGILKVLRKDLKIIKRIKGNLLHICFVQLQLLCNKDIPFLSNFSCSSKLTSIHKYTAVNLKLPRLDWDRHWKGKKRNVWRCKMRLQNNAKPDTDWDYTQIYNNRLRLNIYYKDIQYSTERFTRYSLLQLNKLSKIA